MKINVPHGVATKATPKPGSRIYPRITPAMPNIVRHPPYAYVHGQRIEEWIDIEELNV